MIDSWNLPFFCYNLFLVLNLTENRFKKQNCGYFKQYLMTPRDIYYYCREEKEEIWITVNHTCAWHSCFLQLYTPLQQQTVIAYYKAYFRKNQNFHYHNIYTHAPKNTSWLKTRLGLWRQQHYNSSLHTCGSKFLRF